MHTAKLTADQVVAIRERYAAGDIGPTELGEEYGVKPLNVYKIVRGIFWRHVGGPLVIR